MKLPELLDGVSAKHRSAVATRIGLPKKATAAEICAHLLDPARLQEIVDGLSSEARQFAARQALGENGPHYYNSRAGEAGGQELERCGLAFALRDSWRTDYTVAGDLIGPLAQALASAHLELRKARKAARWLGAPLQLAHDAAAVWAVLHREPVRVKTDGEIYQRSWPKLVAALAALDLDEFVAEVRDRRLLVALAFLREEGCLRLRLDSSNGWETKRELTATGGLLELLSREPAELRWRLLAGAGCEPLELAALTLLPALGPGAEISLASFGRAAREFADEATRYPPPRHGTDTQAGASAVAIAWLVGLAEIGLDDAGRPCAVRLACVEPETRAGPLAVCQGNFEVVLLALPGPAERLKLELTCESVPGQPHVYTITKRAAIAGERAGAHPGGTLGLLRELAGVLPQNVERTVGEWAAGYGAPVRVRTAMMLDAGDPATADRLASGPLDGLVLERVGGSLLAFPADRLDEVRRALEAAGRELEPGLDQISGTWKEPRSGGSEAQAEWEPRSARPDPVGRLVSTLPAGSLPAARTQIAPVRSPVAAIPPLTLVTGSDDEDEPVGPLDALDALDRDEDGGDDRPLDVILDAIEDETDVRITYAGADGVTDRTITPIDVEGAQVHAWCHLSDGEHRFWIPSILAAIPAHEG